MSETFDSLVNTVSNLLAPHGPGGSFAPGDYSIHFFLQLAVILGACFLFGRLVGLLRQPPVVGEMIAGVVLGPSLLGLLFPGLQATIFPPETRNLLYAGAQLGVGLYMFIVGTTLRVDHFRSKGPTALAVSIAGIAAPFGFAVLITPLLLDVGGLFAPGISRANATLFLGACIALTAFPMLARIINERGLANSSLGTLSLTAGAFDDACSWCVLAIVLAAFGGGPGVAVLAIGGGLAWAAFLFFVGPQILAPLGRSVEREGRMTATHLAIVMIAFSISALLMDLVGIHAIFGGFAIGAVMPRGLLTEEIKRKIEPLTVVLLLPMFFTYSGLNTRLDVVNSADLLLIAALILVASVLAKAGACYIAARLCGEENSVALGIAALMNARGLMELIIINIGLQKGIIGPALFAILVLMAIVTTMMANPMFDVVMHRARSRDHAEPVPGA
ncbi:Kef-type K+ transport system membrane component KefB [Sphingomonas zeicaulis]|uniref:cation:proton antiporter n=1 Tax=Sphingomonas zeicaulis TaxID=1632740 RepID=UPI003D21CD8C